MLWTSKNETIWHLTKGKRVPIMFREFRGELTIVGFLVAEEGATWSVRVFGGGKPVGWKMKINVYNILFIPTTLSIQSATTAPSLRSIVDLWGYQNNHNDE